MGKGPRACHRGDGRHERKLKMILDGTSNARQAPRRRADRDHRHAARHSSGAISTVQRQFCDPGMARHRACQTTWGRGCWNHIRLPAPSFTAAESASEPGDAGAARTGHATEGGGSRWLITDIASGSYSTRRG